MLSSLRSIAAAFASIMAITSATVRQEDLRPVEGDERCRGRYRSARSVSKACARRRARFAVAGKSRAAARMRAKGKR